MLRGVRSIGEVSHGMTVACWTSLIAFFLFMKIQFNCILFAFHAQSYRGSNPRFGSNFGAKYTVKQSLLWFIYKWIELKWEWNLTLLAMLCVEQGVGSTWGGDKGTSQISMNEAINFSQELMQKIFRMVFKIKFYGAPVYDRWYSSHTESKWSRQKRRRIVA